MVGDSDVKHRIREAAEAEEREFYESRAVPDRHFRAELRHCGSWQQNQTLLRAGIDGDCGAGVLITALHHAGLATLTHTPSPMKFLSTILDRPAHERPFLLLVVGYSADGAQVPVIRKKLLDEIATFV